MREYFLDNYGPLGPTHVPFPRIDGRQFEQHVYECLSRNISSHQDNSSACRISLTPRSADRGRDIVIENFNLPELFAFRYSSIPSTIVIECKLAGKERLSFEHLASNLLQLEHYRSAAFLLVTNATLTPRSIALAHQQCRRIGVQFQLIDAYTLLQHIPQLRTLATTRPAKRKDSYNAATPRLQVSYQALPDVQPDTIGYTIHVIMRSFGEGTFRVGAKLHSTLTWKSSNPGKKDTWQLSGDDLVCVTLGIQPVGAKLPQNATLALNVDGAPELFNVSLAGSEHTIDLPLFGDLIEAVSDYEQSFHADSSPFILHLHAPSGTGKTRFLQEIGRRVGPQNVLWLRVRDDGTALVGTPGRQVGQTRLLESVSQGDMIGRIQQGLSKKGPPRLIFIDDLHAASQGTLDSIESLAFNSATPTRMILAGRSDPAVRQPRYEAFTHLLAQHGGDLQKTLSFSDLERGQVAEIIASLIPGQGADSLASLSDTSGIRPVEVVHYIHSLLERGFVHWIDEDKLGVQSAEAVAFSIEADSPTLASEVLDLRLEFLDTINVGGSALTDILAILALKGDPQLTSRTLKVLRRDHLVSKEVLVYWFREDPFAELAFPAHDTIAERLVRRCYQFSRKRNFGAVLRLLPFVQEELGPEQEAVMNLHEGNIEGATPFLASIGKRLRCVGNITSLPLEEGLYDNLGALIFLLENRSRPCPSLFCRAVIARAYLNMHCRSFVDGLLDCLELLGLLKSLGDLRRTDHLPAAIRQLVAHGLLNSGDLKTALSLMHEVENLLPKSKDSRIVSAIEFDMCDRLQSYYTQQSAFDLARTFFLRGRSCAYRSDDQTLISISLSGEFHLFRYLDVEASVRRALQQVRHAKKHAPLRQQMHAEVNHLVARWNRQSGAAPAGLMDTLEAIRETCKKHGYAHLVPRIDYLKALDAYYRHESAECTLQEFQAALRVTRYSALYYGYGEYLVLCDNLSLLHAISVGRESAEITTQARKLIRDLERAGLTFIAGRNLCYNTVVILSNSLRAVYTYSDEATAWRIAERVRFSPILCPTKGERQRLLETAFTGGLLCNEHDPTAVARTAEGYFTILA